MIGGGEEQEISALAFEPEAKIQALARRAEINTSIKQVLTDHMQRDSLAWRASCL